MNNSIIDLENARIYQQDTMILQQVNLQLKQGEFVYLIGKTGSGKSTLLKSLYGELSIASGKGTVADYDLTRLKTSEIPYLRRKIGIVFQDFQLLTDRTVGENLYFIMKATSWKNKDLMKKRLQEVLSKVGLGTKHYKMPHELSGGEQQRVVIARALINEPLLILADEPTGNLDPETSSEIMKLLFEISKSGTAILMATHNYDLIDKFPARLVKVENGKVWELPQS